VYRKMDLPKWLPRVALLSSTKAVLGPMEEAFRTEFPEAQIIHLLDETFLDDFRQDMGLSHRSRRKALQMAMTAHSGGWCRRNSGYLFNSIPCG